MLFGDIMIKNLLCSYGVWLLNQICLCVWNNQRLRCLKSTLLIFHLSIAIFL